MLSMLDQDNEKVQFLVLIIVINLTCFPRYPSDLQLIDVFR